MSNVTVSYGLSPDELLKIAIAASVATNSMLLPSGAIVIIEVKINNGYTSLGTSSCLCTD